MERGIFGYTLSVDECIKNMTEYDRKIHTDTPFYFLFPVSYNYINNQLIPKAQSIKQYKEQGHFYNHVRTHNL